MYKCCWNCGNGFTACCSTKEASHEFECTRRFCCASRPIASHSINPYQKRTCKQFEEPYNGRSRFGHIIEKDEAESLMSMGKDEQVAYWDSNKK